MNLLEELRALLRLYAQQFKTTFASMLAVPGLAVHLDDLVRCSSRWST